MVRGEPSGQSDFPKLELPIFLDMDYGDSTKKEYNSIIKSLPKMDTEAAQEGLTSFVDGSTTRELDKLLHEMEVNIVSRKMKTVSFADQEQKRKRKTHITESASPSRYRIRAAVREEAASTPTKSVKETVSPGRTAHQ
jgi:uncharacterized protein YifN (PemK superfamily)